MSQNSRELVREFFDGNTTERLPFLPWVCSFAAKLEQVPVNLMLSDPGVLSRALSNAHKLFGYDVILNHFDPVLEAEALGCELDWNGKKWPPAVTGHLLGDGVGFYDLDTEDIENKGRIPVILEATKILILTEGREVPIAALVTGPLTLAGHLRGRDFNTKLEQEDEEALDLVEDTGSICLKLCRAYCELGADILVIAEDMQDMIIRDISSVLASPLKSIINVTRFYNAVSILIGKVRDDNQAVSAYSLGADAVSLSGNINADKVQIKAREENCRFSIPVPDSAFLENDLGNIGLIKRAIESGESGIFLSSEWEVPRDTDVNNMHRIMKTIRGE